MQEKGRAFYAYVTRLWSKLHTSVSELHGCSLILRRAHLDAGSCCRTRWCAAVFFFCSPEVVIFLSFFFKQSLPLLLHFSVKLQTDGKNEEAAKRRTVSALSQDTLASRLARLRLFC